MELKTRSGSLYVYMNRVMCYDSAQVNDMPNYTLEFFFFFLFLFLVIIPHMLRVPVKIENCLSYVILQRILDPTESSCV